MLTANTMDFTYDNVSVALWSCIETNATVVVGSFATMKPLLSKWFPNLIEGRNSGDGDGNAAGLQAQIHVSERVPTIGSTPLRHGKGRHQWTQLGRSKTEEKDEAAVEISLDGGVEKRQWSDGGSGS